MAFHSARQERDGDEWRTVVTASVCLKMNITMPTFSHISMPCFASKCDHSSLELLWRKISIAKEISLVTKAQTKSFRTREFWRRWHIIRPRAILTIFYLQIKMFVWRQRLTSAFKGSWSLTSKDILPSLSHLTQTRLGNNKKKGSKHRKILSAWS